MADVLVVDLGGFSLKGGLVSRNKRKQDPTLNGAVAPMIRDGDFIGDGSAPPLIRAESDVAALSRYISDNVDRRWSDATSATGKSLVLLLPVESSRLYREALMRSTFEAVAPSALFMGYSAPMALVSTGNTTGTVLDVGSRCTRVVHVIDTQPVHLYTTVTPVGGKLQSDIARRTLQGTGAVAADFLSERFVHSFKASHCTASSGGGGGRDHAITLALPDGEKISVSVPGDAMAAIGDVLFAPRSAQVPELGIIEALALSFREAAVTAPSTCAAWIACGGPCAMNGFMERVDAEAQRLVHLPLGSVPAPQRIAVRDPVLAPFAGASLFAQLASFPSHCITSKEFAEAGPARCVERCVADRF